MAFNISRIINSFLRKKDLFNHIANNFEKKIIDLFESVTNNLKQNYLKWKNTPSVKDKFNKLNLKELNSNTLKVSFELLQDFLNFEDNISLILKICETFLYNLEEIILTTPIIENSLYHSLYNFIKESLKRNFLESKGLLLSVKDDLYSLALIVDTILVFREKIEIEISLENVNNFEYEKYLSDWTLKYAQIIEGPLKKALIFLLKVKFFSWNKDYNQLRDEMSIKKILRKLNLDETLADYRNAIFHQSLRLVKEPEIKNKQIIFKGLRKSITLTLEEYREEYYKVLIFLFTIYLATLKVYFDNFKDLDKIINQYLARIKSFLDNLKILPFDIFQSDLLKNDKTLKSRLINKA